MYVIVVGCGDVGAQLAILLSTEGHDVIIVDKNPGSFKRLGSAFNGIKITGYGFDEDVLREAGIEKCDAFAAVTDQDNSNMMAAEVASRIYKVSKVVARLYNAERESTFQQLGLEYVCATTMVAQSVLERLVEGHGHHLVMRGDTELIEFIASSAVDNKKVIEVQIPNEFRICLVTRDGSTFIPWRESILRERDTILAIIKNESHAAIKKYIRKA
ncbi:MAG: TrkA family potassium uptake protein [Deltaproteobacteria bacterium]|nr:TrkA family potassium uptake protein [Deltaproteobacteria bacterium]